MTIQSVTNEQFLNVIKKNDDDDDDNERIAGCI